MNYETQSIEKVPTLSVEISIGLKIFVVYKHPSLLMKTF
jgi:hypothetical protein